MLSPASAAVRSDGTAGHHLPGEFADLEGWYAQWGLSTANARYEKRLASTMEQMQGFYDALLPRAPAVIQYCERADIHNPPPEVRALLRLMYMLITVSFAIEVWHQPRVINGGSIFIDAFIQPAV